MCIRRSWLRIPRRDGVYPSTLHLSWRHVHLRRLSSTGCAEVALSSPVTCSPCMVGTSFIAWSQRRRRSFHFYLNMEDPEETRRHVEEDLARLAQAKQQDTSAYLHSLLNLALSYYQAKDFIKAREFAEYTHSKALAYNPKSSLVFLTAKTCSHCAEALANEYERHVAEANERREVSVALAPRPSVVFAAERAIRKLREDAKRFEGIAQRIYARPDMAFMRGWGDFKTDNSSRKGNAHRDTRCRWTEDVTGVDEEYERQYGVRWQERRKRPEHAAFTKHSQKVASDGNWKVPK